MLQVRVFQYFIIYAVMVLKIRISLIVNRVDAQGRKMASYLSLTDIELQLCLIRTDQFTMGLRL